MSKFNFLPQDPHKEGGVTFNNSDKKMSKPLCDGTRNFDRDRDRNQDRDQKYEGTGTGTNFGSGPGPGPGP